MSGSQRALVDGWADYAGRFHWQVYGHLTFATPYSRDAARKAVIRWLDEFGPGAYAIVATERGPAGGRTHCHVLLGGMTPRDENGSPLDYELGVNRASLAAAAAAITWRCGNAVMKPYDPKSGGRWYVAKNPDDVELLGTPSRHRARRGRDRRPRRERPSLRA